MRTKLKSVYVGNSVPYAHVVATLLQAGLMLDFDMSYGVPWPDHVRLDTWQGKETGANVLGHVYDASKEA